MPADCRAHRTFDKKRGTDPSQRTYSRRPRRERPTAYGMGWIWRPTTGDLDIGSRRPVPETPGGPPRPNSPRPVRASRRHGPCRTAPRPEPQDRVPWVQEGARDPATRGPRAFSKFPRGGLPRRQLFPSQSRRAHSTHSAKPGQGGAWRRPWPSHRPPCCPRRPAMACQPRSPWPTRCASASTAA